MKISKRFVPALMGWSLLWMGMILSLSHSLQGQCSSCGEGDTIPVRFYAQTITDNGAISATFDNVNGVTVTSPSAGLSLKNTGNGLFRVLKNRVYEGIASVSSEVLPSGSHYPMVVIFYPEDACGLKLETRCKLSSESSWSDWREQDYVSRGVTFKPISPSYTMNFQVRLVERNETNEESQPSSEDTDVETGGSSASIPAADADDAPASAGAPPAQVTPSSFHSTAGLGEGLSGYKVGAIRLAGPLAGSLADLTKLEFSNPLVEPGLDEVRVSGNLRQIFTSKDLIDFQVVSGGGVQLRYYQSGEFEETKVSGLYPITGEPFKTVRYLPLAEEVGQHFGGVRTVVEGSHGVTYTKDVVSLSADGLSFRTIEENGLRVVDVVSSFEWCSDGASAYWVRNDQVTESRSGHLYSKQVNRHRYMNRMEGAPSAIVESYEFLMERWDYVSLDRDPLITRYVPDSTFAGLAGAIIRPDGSWERYSYYTGEESGSLPHWRGLVKEIMRPWNHSPTLPENATSSNCEVTVITYHASGNLRYRESTRVTRVPRESAMVETSKWQSEPVSITVESLVNLLGQAGLASAWAPLSFQLDAEQIKTFASSGEFIREHRFTYDYVSSNPSYPWDGRDFARLDAVSSGSITGYQMGSFDELTSVFTVDETPLTPDGTHIQSIEVQVAGLALTANESTKVVTITDLKRRVLSKELWIYVGDDEWDLATRRTYEYPEFWEDGSIREVIEKQDGRVLRHHLQVSATEVRQWDEQGIETISTTDLMGRTLSRTQVGTTGQEDRVTSYAYEGRTTTLTQSGGNLSQVTSTLADLLGRRILETDESGATTAWEYPNGGRDVVEERPGGVTWTTTRDISLNVVSMTGNANVQQFHAREVDESGNLVTTVRSGAVDSPRYVRTVTDWAGRVIEEIRPSPSGTGEVTVSRAYHSQTYELSRMASDAETGSDPVELVAPHLYEVPSWSQSLRRYGSSVSDATTLALHSEDPIQEELRYYSFEGGVWWRVSERRQYTRTNGYSESSWMTHLSKESLSGTLSATVILYPQGEAVSTTTVFDRVSKTRTETVDTNRSDIDAVRVNINGLDVSASSHFSSTPTQWDHDALGRVVRETSPTGAVTRTAYRRDGKVEATLDSYGASTRYDYYPPDHPSSGLVARITMADGGVTTYSYTTSGKVAEISGSASYRTTYGYDAYGALVTLGTWRTGAGADVTTWTYQAGTGLLSAKTDVGFPVQPAFQKQSSGWFSGLVWRWRNRLGGRLPSASCGRSSL